MTRALLLITIGVMWASGALATDRLMPDPQDEARARHLFAQLKCEACAGQSLAGSHAELAVSMRNLIRRQIGDGTSDAEILAYFVERYGDDILMNPPKARHTTLLWAAPWLMVAGALACLLLWLRKQKVQGAP